LFDNGTLPIPLFVEALVLVCFIGFSRDHWADPMGMKPVANPANAVRFVTGQPLRTLAWPSNRLRYADAIKNGFNLG
jgi:hypothetical protein